MVDERHLPAPTRRDALRAGAAAAFVAATPRVHAAGSDVGEGIKIGLIGCGGRGAGAVLDAVGAATQVIYPAEGFHTEDAVEGARATKKGIEVVALADLFEDRLERCAANLAAVGQPVPAENRFVGIDAYQQLLSLSEVNYVILATPPHFRPEHFRAAVDAGKHAFLEKPAAVDGPGVRTVLEAGRAAYAKGLGVAAGTQRRHEAGYRETIARLQNGEIGAITHGKCYWNGGEIWTVNRRPEWSDMEWQLRNWNYFTWLSGDHIVEQHVHNLDVMNWVLDATPIRAVSGMGGRQARTGSVHGYVWDHFAVELEYPGGVSVFSQCRQTNGCKTLIREEVYGEDGWSDCRKTITPKEGKRWRRRARNPRGYRAEHEHLIASIRDGKPINEAETIAHSTLTGILAREAAYTGQEISWEQALNSTTRRGPDSYEMGDCPVPEVPIPGKYQFA